ncbi:MAG: ferrochelatase [Arenimonas sp.]|nr:ferrochelatase [Arenimonas sp.]MBP6309652.1 ferrochelatase [Arenimonas sp.]
MTQKNPKTLALIVNLGTPDEPTSTAVRRFLGQFLHDYRVVDMSRWLWCILLHFIILPIRSGRVAKNYQKIWLKQGSPLLVYSQNLADKLQHQMPNIRVRLAMSYGQPAIDKVLAENKDIEELIVLPLYPQYSATTTASVFDAVSKHYQKQERIPSIRFISEYYQSSAWLDAMEARIRTHWDLHGQADVLIFSFHGIPIRFADRGDPYPQQCQHSAELIAERLQLSAEQWMLTYQSRFGREPWLQPFTDKTLQSLPSQGLKTIDIICPGFAVDCLETLEEIQVENAHIFTAAGGLKLNYISALNDESGHVAALACILEAHAIKHHD